MRVTFARSAWDDYLYWQMQDKKTLKRINLLIQDIQRNRHEGLGKPEPLVGDLAGCWSRRVNDHDRLVYRLIDGGELVEILQCRGHYQ